MGKGQDFERQFCKVLSLWFSKNERDDLFWRTSGSGSRATFREKVGKDTLTHKGDVAGIVEESIKWLGDGLIELKNGYSPTKLIDFFYKKSLVLDWIKKAQKKVSGSDFMIVHRYRKKTLVYIGLSFFVERIKAKDSFLDYILLRGQNLIVVSFDDFLNSMRPVKYYQDYKNEG